MKLVQVLAGEGEQSACQESGRKQTYAGYLKNPTVYIVLHVFKNMLGFSK